MSGEKKFIFIKRIVNIFCKKNIFVGFFVSFFFIIFNFFVLKEHLFLNGFSKYFFYFTICIQIFLYFFYFMNIDVSKKNIFFIFSLIFTIIIILIMSIGSLWIFDHLNH